MICDHLWEEIRVLGVIYLLYVDRIYLINIQFAHITFYLFFKHYMAAR